MNYKCIIFDCDGVLVDSLPLSDKVMLELIRPYGISDVFEKIISNYNGGSLQASLDKIEELIGQKLPDNFVEQYRKLTYETFKKELLPVSGVNEFLKKITVPMCVASSGPRTKIIENLKTTNLLHYFGDNIVSSYEIQSWKPEPEIFLYAANKMGFKPNECVVIEDSLDGINAALKGGFNIIGLATDSTFSEMELTEAKVFKSIVEIEQFLLEEQR
ncbi:MAG: HAD family hydrolase [Balneolaceae bacterium]